MENTYLKMIGQKVCNGKIILIAVVDEDFMNCGEVPNIFETQCLKRAPNIYTGTYPNITVNIETIKSREDLTGLGINGILTSENWYCSKEKEEDIYGIVLP